MDLAPPPTDTPRAPAPPPPRGSTPPSRIVGGVAAWLADRLGVDALWVRIAFVLLTLVGGVGLLVYGAMWLAFIVGAEADRHWARVAGGAALVLGLPLLLSAGFDLFDGAAAILVLLVGLALALWQPRRAAPGDASSPTDERDVPSDPRVTGPDALAPAVDRTPRRPFGMPTVGRQPSILGRLTLGVAILVGAVGALIDQANGGRLHPEQWLGAAAITCGVGLVVGAFAGRARWLVVPAVVLAAAGVVAGEAARIGVEPSALLGDRSVHIGPGDPGGRRQEHVVIGSVDVSIDGPPTSPITVDARTGVGVVDVWAASDVTVEVRASVDHGGVDVEGIERPEGTFTIGPEGAPDVIVQARVGWGRVDVRQYVPVRTDEATIGAGRPHDVADGVTLTASGRFVLAGGEAVLDVDDSLLAGGSVARDRVTVIPTSLGEFQLLPGRLLLTPSGELLDLPALRALTADVTTPPVTPAATTPLGTTVPPATTAPPAPPVTAVPALPTITTIPGG